MKTKPFTLFLVALLSVAPGVLAQAPEPTEKPSVDRLTLREQVGQTLMPRVVIGKQKIVKDSVLKGEVGGFFIKAHEGLVTHPTITAKNEQKFIAKQRKKLLKTIKDLTKWAAKSPHQIPLLLAFDYEGGTVTSPLYMGLKQMPSNMLLSATGDEKLVEEMYAAQAKEILLTGANTALGPVTDVNSNPLNPIIQTRSFGDNASTVGRLSAAAVRGLEGQGIPAFVKHFPGHGDTSVDSHYTQPVTALPAEELWATHNAAFQTPIDAGVTGVMSAHVVYPALDAENSAMFSTAVMQGLLRQKMGFNGLIATDGLDMGAVQGLTVEEIVRRAYSAGNNMLLLSGSAIDLKTAATYPKRAADYVESEAQKDDPAVSPAFIRASAQQILDLKERMGLFDTVPVDTDSRMFCSFCALSFKAQGAKAKTHFDEISQQAAQKGVTLVRDTQHLIPFTNAQKTICTVTFSEGIFSTQVQLLSDELKEGGKTVLSVAAPYTPTAADVARAKVCAQDADVLVLGSSRKSAMDQAQQDAVNALLALGKPTVLVSLLNPYEIALYPQSKTVLALYGPTLYTVQTAAQILLGKQKAQGKLPIQLH